MAIILPDTMRHARRDDAPDLAFLINEAGEGLAEYFWKQGCGDADPWAYGIERAARDEGDFSWRNAWVTERGGQVVAMLLGFVIEAQRIDYDALSDLVRPLARLEQQAVGSWYINAIAARAEWRGQGIGSELLSLAHALAIETGCEAVSLQNFTSNAAARRLYQRFGFVEARREPMPRMPGLPDFGDSILHVMAVDRRRAAPYLA